MKYISTIIMVCVIIWGVMQKRKIYQLEKELNSIKEQIEYSIKSTQGLILTSTESVPIKELVKSINNLLNAYYSGQVNCKKQKETMQQVMTNISHDLRTPLTVLSGYIEILEEKSSKIDMPEEIVVIIHKLSIKIKNSVRLINQFFNLAQIESGDIKYDIKKYNITSLCREIVLGYYDLLYTKGYDVEINIPEYPIFVRIDKKAAIRIIKNIIDNAIKYGDDGKYLGITVEEKEKEVYVLFEDHGQGIENIEIEKIFNRSYTLSDTNKNYESSGLGLAISKNLANGMNSDILVKSIPHKQTVFNWKIKK